MKRSLCAVALALAGSPLCAADVDVYVKNENGIGLQSVSVAAIHFSSNGPDSLLTKIALTDASGLARFSAASSNALADNTDFEILATTQGYLPSLRDQLNSPSHVHLVAAPGVSTPTITLSSAGVSGVGEVDVDVRATTSTLVFASIVPNGGSGGDAVAFGAALTAGPGAGAGMAQVRICNVPFTEANVFSINVYDPVKNRSAGRMLDQEISSFQPSYYYAGASGLDLTGSNAMPVSRAVNQAQQDGSAGGLSVDGVVMDTNSISGIPHIGISYQGRYVVHGSTHNDFRWAHTDENGRFQLFSLRAGVTYYAQVYGGCDWRRSICFQGITSPGQQVAAVGAAPQLGADFLYPSTSTVLTKTIQLLQAPGGSGQVAVYVKDSNGNPIPQAWVNLGPDNMHWRTGGSCAGPAGANPGLATANSQATTGYALLSGLPSGNYMIQVWTQFDNSKAARFNDGPDARPCWQTQSCQCGTDDLRVSIDTTSSTTADVFVFDSSGTSLAVNLSSLTIRVPVQVNASGQVKGTLTFPSGGIDLSADPVTITLQSNCQGGGPCPSGGYAYFNAASTGPTIDYSISLSSGFRYFLNVTSNYWGVTGQHGSRMVDLSSSPVATVRMNFARAGRLQGRLYKPDGSVFQPSYGQNGSWAWMQVEGLTVEGGNGAQVNQDGSFSIGGLVPGTYALRPDGNGTGYSYARSQKSVTAEIAALTDTYQDYALINGVPIRIDLTTANASAIAFPNCALFDQDNCPPENFRSVLLPAGSPLDQDVIGKLMFNDDRAVLSFHYVTNPQFARRCSGEMSSPGFCVNRVPSPSLYDAYLLRQGEFDKRGIANVRPYFVILHSTRNVVVSESLSTTPHFWSGSTVNVRPINLTPTPSLAGGAVGAVKGTVTGASIIRSADFAALAGDMENITKLLPTTLLYDANGVMKAAGVSVPDPVCFGQPLTRGATTQEIDAWFDQAIAQGDFTFFGQILSGCGNMGYEIRGLSTGTYTAITTTPNYPPCQTTIQLLAAGATVQSDVNLDVCAGSGGTISGVVRSTSGVVLPNAAVSIEAENYKLRATATNTGGLYSFAGLPVGSFKVRVSASGYAPGRALVSVTGAGSYTSDFSLPTGGASIAGTVYAAKVPFVQVQSGAQILAYDDTVNIANPAIELPIYKTVTSSVGFYRLDGLTVGDVYKVFVRVPGKYVASQSTVTVSGTLSGLDFTLQNKPLDIVVHGRPVASNYEFTIANPKDFKSGQAWVGASPFVLGTSTDVSNDFQELPDNKLLLAYPLSRLTAGVDYTLRIRAVALSGQTISKDVSFGTARRASSLESIDDALLGDDSDAGAGRRSNQALLDASGDNPSAVSIPAGAMIPVSSAAIPSASFTQLDVSASTIAASAGGASAFASGVYQLTFSSLNYTSKGFDLTLAYDKSDASIADLALYHYDDAKAAWELVPGLQTIDPVKGTITSKRVKSLASVLGLRNGHPMLARSDGRSFSPSALAPLAASDSGSFAVLRPSLVGSQVYSGDKLRVFNFPNPFNLASKTLSLSHGTATTTSLTTTGTIIKYELPSGISGHVVIRIYNLAAELVRELDEGDRTGGTYNYTVWDGRNFNGNEVANGVYYGVLSVPGTKAKDGRFTMAVVK